MNTTPIDNLKEIEQITNIQLRPNVFQFMKLPYTKEFGA